MREVREWGTDGCGEPHRRALGALSAPQGRRGTPGWGECGDEAADFALSERVEGAQDVPSRTPKQDGHPRQGWKCSANSRAGIKWGIRARNSPGQPPCSTLSDMEGVASHHGPASCVWGGDAAGEAWAGVRAGQPLSSEIKDTGAPTAFRSREGYTGRRARCERRSGPTESKTLCMRGSSIKLSQNPRGLRCRRQRGGCKARRRKRCSPLHRLLRAPSLRPDSLASPPAWVLR